MKYLTLSILLMTGFLSGCTIYQIESKDSTQDFYAPKKSVDEVVYLESIDKPYEEIGTVMVTTERRNSLEDVLPKLLYEAAILGGDAITDIQTNATGTWQKIRPQKLLGNAYIREQVTAKVVVLK